MITNASQSLETNADSTTLRRHRSALLGKLRTMKTPLAATMLLLFLLTRGPAEEPTPEIPYPGEMEFVWWSPGGDYRSYSLRLSAVQRAEVQATFILIQDGKLGGRFPLRRMDHTDPRLPIHFSVANPSHVKAGSN